ncbi:hypothetical protein, partial [Salmonella enterica]|uniref:hypothetical protein n=1 Tax=Salmonella enterica TaxID=28901 RepID=UPI00398C7020
GTRNEVRRGGGGRWVVPGRGGKADGGGDDGGASWERTEENLYKGFGIPEYRYILSGTKNALCCLQLNQ